VTAARVWPAVDVPDLTAAPACQHDPRPAVTRVVIRPCGHASTLCALHVSRLRSYEAAGIDKFRCVLCMVRCVAIDWVNL
jgi:hypothetical protein